MILFKMYFLLIFFRLQLCLVTALEVEVWRSEKNPRIDHFVTPFNCCDEASNHDVEDECKCQQTGLEMCYSDRVVDEKIPASNSTKLNRCGDIKDAENDIPRGSYMKIVHDRPSGKELYFKLPIKGYRHSDILGSIFVNNASSVNLVLDCDVDYIFILANTTDINFEHSEYSESSVPCRAGIIRGFNITLHSNMFSFQKIKLLNSSMIFNNETMGIELIDIKNSRITNLNILELAPKYKVVLRSKIENSEISNVKALHEFKSFKIINSFIFQIDSDAVRVRNMVLENTDVNITTRNGLHFMDSSDLNNVNFGTVEQYGISFMPGVDGTITIKNLKIDSCEVPCMKILEIDESFTWDIVNVTINGEYLNDTLGNYIEVQNFKHPEKNNEAEPELVEECVEENMTLSCDFSTKEYTQMDFSNFTNVEIQNAHDIQLFTLPCTTKTLSIKNVTISAFNEDWKDAENCSNNLLINITDSKLYEIYIDRNTEIIGRDIIIDELVAVSPFNISNTDGTDNVLRYFKDSIISDGNHFWSDVRSLLIKNVTVLGNWTIDNTIFWEITNLIVKNNLTIMNSNIYIFTGVVKSGALLNIINCSFTKMDNSEGNMFIEEGSFVNLDGSTKSREEEVVESSFSTPILITSYDQVVGNNRWFLNSSVWIPMEVLIKHPQPLDPYLPVFGSEPLKELTDDTLEKYRENNQTHFIYDFKNNQQIDINQNKTGSEYFYRDYPHSYDYRDYSHSYDLEIYESVIYKNANVIRVQLNRHSSLDKIIFQDIASIIIYQEDMFDEFDSLPEQTSGGISLNTLELHNASSAYLNFDNIRILKLSRSKIGTLSTFINQKIEVFDSDIKLLSVVARNLHFENLTIERIERLMVNNEGIITNCKIESFNASALLANEKSNLKMVNVTIGFIDREGIILLNKIHLENVTIANAVSDSIVMNPAKNPTFKNVNIEDGDERTFRLLMSSVIIDPSVTINGRKIHFNVRGIRPSFEKEEILPITDESNVYMNLKYFGYLFMCFVFGVTCTAIVIFMIYWRRKSGSFMNGSGFVEMDEVSDQDGNVADRGLGSVNNGQHSDRVINSENVSADDAVFSRFDAVNIRNSPINDGFTHIPDDVNLVLPDDTS